MEDVIRVMNVFPVTAFRRCECSFKALLCHTKWPPNPAIPLLRLDLKDGKTHVSTKACTRRHTAAPPWRPRSANHHRSLKPWKNKENVAKPRNGLSPSQRADEVRVRTAAWMGPEHTERGKGVTEQHGGVRSRGTSEWGGPGCWRAGARLPRPAVAGNGLSLGTGTDFFFGDEKSLC